MRDVFVIGICFVMAMVSCSETPEVTPAKESQEKTLFSRISSDSSGVHFVNEVVENEVNNYFTNQYVFNGGGVAAGDVNNDGLPDLFFTGNDADDKLYLNLGDFRFQDFTTDAGIKQGDNTWSTGVTMVDINGDGWLDIYVCKAGHGKSPLETQNLFYLNRGDGTFVEMGGQLALNDAGFSTQASFFDYDNDGDIDLYVMNYPGEWDDKGVLLAREGHQVPPRFTDNLYRNDGNAQFSRVSFESGINNYAFGLGLVTTDVNDDGWLDIYVANDYQENDYLYINNQDGSFSEQIKDFTNHNSQSSMGLDFGDINNDGHKDFFVAEMLPEDYRRSKVNMASMNPEAFWSFIDEGMHFQYMRNVLQMNTGSGFFSDVAQMCGVHKTDWSWSPLLVDFDNDGDEDLYVSNGIKRDMMYKDATKHREKLNKQNKSWNYQEAYNMIPSTKLANYTYRNDGDLTFTKTSSEWGLGELSFSNGAIYCDLNRDGAVDIVVNNLEEKAWIYKNNTNDAAWSAVRVMRPGQGNRYGLNAEIHLWVDGEKFSKEIRPTRGFQSSVEAIAHFGLGSRNQIDSLLVEWGRGEFQILKNVPLNQYVDVVYDPVAYTELEVDHVLFEEVTTLVLDKVYTHEESSYDDFVKEILLPHRQSTLGPFISKGDLNGDGSEDFYIGGAAGAPGVFYYYQQGKFVQDIPPAFDDDRGFEDMQSSMADFNGDGLPDLYVVSGSNEFEDPRMYQDRLYLNQGGGKFEKADLPEISSNGLAVSVGDIDSDGDVDVFVGAAGVPGQYPFADESFFLINDGGTFEKKTTEICASIEALGMITGVELADFNGDGRLDLFVVGEWMHPTLLEGVDGGFVESEAFDDTSTGWWRSLHASDLDGDGDLDLIAGNMGENHKFRPTEDKPFHIYAHDFDENGVVDIVLAKPADDETLVPIRGKQCMSEQMPFISEERFDTYEDFAGSDLSEILGEDKLKEASAHHIAQDFSSSTLINDGSGKFTLEKLPPYAQLSSVNGIATVDLDGDGQLEIMLAGNMFDTEVETSRADASVGCLIQENEALLNSGFFAPGNVKDLKIIETESGKFVLVANNNAPVQVFKLK